MTTKDRVFIKNVYYMLAYAFQNLNPEQYEQVQTEEFDHLHDLFAAILTKGIARQLKQGLYREYIPHFDDLAVLRGKIDLPRTMQLHAGERRELGCEYDEMSENNLLNQVLKTVSLMLVRHGEVKPRNKAALKKLLLFFTEVDPIDPAAVRWSAIRFSRATRSYRMLISVCQLVAEGMLQTTQSGNHKLMSYIDDQAMSRLYEKFILEYYKRHWSRLHPKAAQISWALDEGERTMLPVMQSDITLSDSSRTLIIDAKYYSKNTQRNYDHHTVHSANLYQIFTYVKNREVSDPHRQIAGMLLYAQTDHAVQPDANWRIHGNQILVQTLDLGQDFPAISNQFDQIVCSHFNLNEGERVA